MRRIISVWHRMTAACVMTVACLWMLLASGTAHSQVTAERYLLQPGDVIAISVLEDPLLDRQTLVAPDGRVALPLAGTLVVEGLTIEQLQRTIQRRLRKNFVERPNVTVSLVSTPEEEEETREVFVLGEVTRPGRYEYDSEKTLSVLQALTLAGGVGPFAATERIQVREVAADTETMRLFDYEAAQDGLVNSPRDLAALRDGAVIIVPERGLFE